MFDIYKIIGALGVLLLSAGILNKKRKAQDVFYIFGGVLLSTYSFHIGDFIFISIQVIFTLAAIYDLIRIKYKK